MSADSQARFKVLIVGVGGQGALTAARLLGEAALAAGLEVMVSQLHGMSQRGGSVECGVFIGAGESAFIGNGEADVIVGLEPLEVLRARPKMSPTTKIVMSQGAIVPSTISAQGKSYPAIDQITEQIRAVTPTLHTVDASALAEQAGAPRSLNVVMLGALAGLNLLPLQAEQLQAAIRAKSSARFRDINRRAFELGAGAILI